MIPHSQLRPPVAAAATVFVPASQFRSASPSSCNCMVKCKGYPLRTNRTRSPPYRCLIRPRGSIARHAYKHTANESFLQGAAQMSEWWHSGRTESFVAAAMLTAATGLPSSTARPVSVDLASLLAHSTTSSRLDACGRHRRYELGGVQAF